MEYLSLPDLKSLTALRAIVELGGVEQAGQHLHVGQPAITKRLRSLEDCYGIPLMQRVGRKLRMTPAGKRVYKYACLALDHQAALVEDLQTMHMGRNQLRLEVTFAIGEQFLPSLLMNFSDRHPQYRIHSRMGYSRRIQTRLATGLSDLALLELAPDHPEILVQKWFDDELILVCAPNHPLCDAQQIGVSELSSQEYVLREPKSSMRIILDRELKDVGIARLPTTLEVGSTETIIEILGRGRHLSFLPRFAVADALASQQLQHIKLAGLRLKMTLWIARNSASVNNPVAEAFIQILRNSTL